MKKILCDHCGAIGYSATAAANLIKSGHDCCDCCGAKGVSVDLAGQETIVLDEEFTYGPAQFAMLVAAICHAADLLGNQHLAGFGALLQHKQGEICPTSEDITLDGIEMVGGRLRNIHRTLSRLAQAEDDESKEEPAGLFYLGLLRVDLERLLHQHPA